MKKVTIAPMLVISLFLMAIQPTYAMPNPKPYTDIPNEYRIVDGEYILDSQGNKYSQFHDSNGFPISLEDALILLNGNSSEQFFASDLEIENSSLTPLGPVTVLEEQVQISALNKQYVESGVGYRVSNEYFNPVSITIEHTCQVSYSITGSFSIEVQTALFNVAKIRAGVDMTMGSSYSRSESATFAPQNSNTIAAIYFKPYYVRVVGTYTDLNGNTRNYTAKYPKLINQRADGLYYLLER